MLSVKLAGSIVSASHQPDEVNIVAKVEMKKIKVLQNTVASGKQIFKGETHQVSLKDAIYLTRLGRAVLADDKAKVEKSETGNPAVGEKDAILKQSVADLKKALSEVDNVEQLNELVKLEEEGQNRGTAKEAIEARLEELKPKD